MAVDESRTVLRNRKVDYTELGLEGNPFPIAGIADPHAPFPLVESVLDDDVHAFMSDTINQEQFCGLLVIGEYGSGKTYALRYLETVLRTSNTNPDAEEILTVYVERPRPSLGALVKDVCERIGKWPLRTIARQIIVSGLAQMAESSDKEERSQLEIVRKQLGERTRGTLFETDPFQEVISPECALNPASVFRRLRSQGVNLLLLKDVGAKVLSESTAENDQRVGDVAKRLAEFALDTDSNVDQHWEAIFQPPGTRRSHAPDGTYSQLVWASIRGLLSHAGYRMIYWLLDEFEEIEYSLSREHEIRGFLTDIRNLIDANLQGFAIVIASKSQTWDFLRELNPGFAHRFARLVVLGPLDREALKKLMISRLNTVRRNGENEGELMPFTEAALDAVVRAAVGNARNAVQMCHFLLWYAATKRISKIDPGLVDRIDEIGNAFHEAQKQAGWRT